jgi:hypothetical protein
MRKRASLPVIAALVVLGCLVVAPSAFGEFVRPAGATPFYAPLDVAYDECTAATPPGNHHNPLNLAGFSCSPPVKSSSWITSGEPTINSAASNFKGAINLKVVVPANVSFVRNTITPTAGSYLQDQRCDAALVAANLTGACANANAAGTPPDYRGLLSGNSFLRITDNNNSTTGGGYTNTGTVKQLLFTVPISCSTTADTSIGSTCIPAAATANAICGCVAALKRSNIEIGQIFVTDGNSDANPFGVTDGPNTDVARQGIFVP